MPTEEQIKSREEVDRFLARVKKPFEVFSKSLKSEWFGRPDEELKGYIEKAHLLEEIKDTRGYQLILKQLDDEITWSQKELEVCKTEVIEPLRQYLKGLRFIRGWIVTTERNADIANSVLAGREGAIGKETFIKPVTAGDRY
jgi:hypothetical protein